MGMMGWHYVYEGVTITPTSRVTETISTTTIPSTILNERPAMISLSLRDQGDVLSQGEISQAVGSLMHYKTVSVNGIPVEIYNQSPQTFNLLFTMSFRIWKQGEVVTRSQSSVLRSFLKWSTKIKECRTNHLDINVLNCWTRSTKYFLSSWWRDWLERFRTIYKIDKRGSDNIEDAGIT